MMGDFKFEPSEFTITDWEEYLSIREEFAESYSCVFHYFSDDAGMEIEKTETQRNVENALHKMCSCFYDLKELFYQALSSNPRFVPDFPSMLSTIEDLENGVDE